jgi:hypothetical protein
MSKSYTPKITPVKRTRSNFSRIQMRKSRLADLVLRPVEAEWFARLKPEQSE